MSLKTRLQNKLDSMNKDVGKKLAKDMKELENHLITIQENQVEQEGYLKKILEILQDEKDK